MDRNHSIGSLNCRVCGVQWQTRINHLSEPIDVFSEWIDACEAENEKRRTGKLVEALADTNHSSTLPHPTATAVRQRSAPKSPPKSRTVAAVKENHAEDEKSGTSEEDSDSFIEPDTDEEQADAPIETEADERPSTNTADTQIRKRAKMIIGDDSDEDV